MSAEMLIGVKCIAQLPYNLICIKSLLKLNSNFGPFTVNYM